MRIMNCVHGLAVAASVVFVSSAYADIQYFGTKQSWQEAVDWWITIDFVQPEAVFITDQYAHLGAIFDGTAAAGPSQSTPSGDGWALVGAWGVFSTAVELTTPRMWMGGRNGRLPFDQALFRRPASC